jgi:thiosulfate/3-mercaptopyruvate sulfurtransferase
MLRALGREAALLDGGLPAWDGPLERGAGVPRPAVPVPVRAWPPERVAGVDEVAAAARAGDVVMVDARATERYTGEVALIDPRPGHIPGARSAPWAANLRADGRFLDAEALRERYRALGISEDTPVIAYCGSGVSACVDLVALEVIGVGDARLFPASWSGWSADPARPAALGSVPGR